MFNLEVFNGMAVAQDLGQQRPQLGDVPLTVAQVVDEAALRLFFRGMEVPVEGGVGRADPQALVEDHEWLSQGRNDVLGVGKGVLQFRLYFACLREGFASIMRRPSPAVLGSGSIMTGAPLTSFPIADCSAKSSVRYPTDRERSPG